MHGELLKVRCSKTSKIFSWREPITEVSRCACCDEAGTLRPHIVWFGEMPFAMERIYEALMQCNFFIAIGTSGQVYPAAGFIGHVPEGARTIDVNRESTALGTAFREQHTGLASDCVPDLVDELLRERVT
jgi:NAD-dependent deacetylase